ncbi:MAG: hypothetical protein WDW36_003771 [Sanguina aurantia]
MSSAATSSTATVICAEICQLFALHRSAGASQLSQKVLHHEPNLHLRQLAQISDSASSLARTFMSPAHKLAALQAST